jgi:hypothetical protein
MKEFKEWIDKKCQEEQMRDRIADLIDSYFGVDSAYYDVDKYELAYHLIENGVVPVVRCKDCRFKTLTEDGEYNPEDIVCEMQMSDGFKENDYCSYGKRSDCDAWNN